jgi:hypothetical protein
LVPAVGRKLNSRLYLDRRSNEGAPYGLTNAARERHLTPLPRNDGTANADTHIPANVCGQCATNGGRLPADEWHLDESTPDFARN